MNEGNLRDRKGNDMNEKTKAERPTKEELVKASRVCKAVYDSGCGYKVADPKSEGYWYFKVSQHLYSLAKILYPTPLPKWPPETVEAFRAWMREFDRVIRDGVPERWGDHNETKDAVCFCSLCRDCPITEICLNTLAKIRMEESLKKRGAHTVACVRMRRDELRKHLDSVGLDWRTPKPTWETVVEIGCQAVAEEKEKSEAQRERKFIRHKAEFLKGGDVKVWITAQSHRGLEFGKDGSHTFNGSYGKRFKSAHCPAHNSDATNMVCWVRGEEGSKDMFPFILPRPEYNAFLALCNEYNEFFSGKDE